MKTEDLVKAAREKEQARDANTLSVVSDSSSFVVPVDLIEVEEQARKTFDDLEELAETIREHGQLQPILVQTKPNGKYLLVGGERRLRAIRDVLMEKTIRATVEEKDLGSLDIRLKQLVENKQRKDYPPLELAEELSELKKRHHFTDKALGEKLGVDPSWITKQRALHDAPEAIKERIRKGTLSVSTFWNNKKLILEKKSRQVLVKVPYARALEVVQILQRLSGQSESLEAIKIPSKPKKEDLLRIISERASDILKDLEGQGQ